MGGGDQLFGIGALLVLKTGLERIGRTLEHPRVGRESAGTSAACAVPNRGRFADHRKPPARERSPIGVARRALEAQYVCASSFATPTRPPAAASKFISSAGPRRFAWQGPHRRPSPDRLRID